MDRLSVWRAGAQDEMPDSMLGASRRSGSKSTSSAAMARRAGESGAERAAFCQSATRFIFRGTKKSRHLTTPSKGRGTGPQLPWII